MYKDYNVYHLYQLSNKSHYNKNKFALQHMATNLTTSIFFLYLFFFLFVFFLKVDKPFIVTKIKLQDSTTGHLYMSCMKTAQTISYKA